MSKLPDFIVIGAGKCGTTSLHQYLSKHPEIYICPKKETFFFLNEESRLQNKKWGAATNLEEYTNLFQEAPENTVVGEFSTVYYSYPYAAQSIYQTLPKVKIIAILRDPSSRAFSDYLMQQRIQPNNKNFTDLITPQNYYIKLGFYYSQLMRYYEIFDKQNIKILLFDDLVNQPQEFLNNLFTYIGVQPNVEIDMSRKLRDSSVPRNKILHKLFIKPGKAKDVTSRILKALPKKLSENLHDKINKMSIYKPTLLSSDRAKLIKIYRSEILRLQDLIDRDLSMWLTL